MRDLLDLLQRQWQLFASAPAVVIATIALAFTFGFGVAKAMYASIAETARERLQAAKEDVERLRGQKEALLVRLDGHGEDIASLKKQMDAQPRYFVSDRPPGPNDIGKEGDIWLETLPQTPNATLQLTPPAHDSAAKPDPSPAGGTTELGR